MPKITIDRERCKGCLLCIGSCPRGLIKLDNKLNRRGVKPVKFTQSLRAEAGSNSSGECLGCMRCALICPDCCIEVWK